MPTEALLRSGSFIAVLLLMLAAESIWPRRSPRSPKFGSFFNNIGISVLSTGVVRLIFPVLPVALAALATERGWGIFNLMDLPYWASFALSVALLDMAIYWQHVAFHRIRPLWRIHRMHHADTDIDASTGVRFHPIEIAASMAFKCLLVVVLGAPAMAVLTFEIILNACSLFNHANLHLPLRLDAPLRLLLVTPDMHRVHHSTDMREANRNYGFCVPWWDFLFRTYKAQPDDGHLDMRIGLNILRDTRFRRLPGMLAIPFLKNG
ncbi:sterol desaturase family protein [Salidesulfovibrio brasiliensis]|uniref:sterol desaturase family protein n=1 Tax=Salidesulfovibrio brasiliensis TaxID=221711 RepID=UPI0006D07E92|nr:sterol desaturase family protein [Salidesulfovibrio brasiliensis]